MKNANIITKLKRILLAIAFCLVATAAVLAPSSFNTVKSANAAGGLTFSGYSSVTEIDRYDTNKEFYVYGVVSNNFIELFGAEFRVNIDPTIFKIKEYLTPTQLSKELNNPLLSNSYGAYKSGYTDIEAGYITCAVAGAITDQLFCIGGCKITVKEGVIVNAGTSSIITIDEVILCDMYGYEPEYKQVNSNIIVEFVSPTIADGLNFSGQCTVSQIATNAENKEFYVYGIVSNNFIELYGAEFRINIDTSVFEIKEYLTPTQLSKELENPLLANSYYAYKTGYTDIEAGYITCAVVGAITDQLFCIGGCKIAVKEGVTIKAGTSSTITIDEVILCDIYGEEPEYIQVYTSMAVWFVPPIK